MSMRVWAIKVGELKPLSRGGLLLLAARCAIRVEPWLPPGAEALWREGLACVTDAAFAVPVRSKAVKTLARELSNRGAAACNRLETTDEPLGRCLNYATSTLSTALDATTIEEVAALKKEVIECAKEAASIAAILAHAGRVRVPSGQDPVDVACLAIWGAMRGDIALLAAPSSKVEGASDRVAALRKQAPLWAGRTPAWATSR